MLERERHHLIRRLVDERSFVSVAELVTQLGASEATIRRDINTMAKRGELRRIRGGAETLHPGSQPQLGGIALRTGQDLALGTKRTIARTAAALVTAGESIIIHGGTTTLALVEFLTNHELDILTNSLPVAAQLLATSRNRVTLPGGTVHREQNIVLSPFGNDMIDSFRGHKLFTSCYGINRFGMMEADPLIVQAQAKLLRRAEEVIVLADSRKLRRESALIVATLDRISTLVTDDGAREEELEAFRSAGVRILTANIADEGLGRKRG